MEAVTVEDSWDGMGCLRVRRGKGAGGEIAQG